MKRNRNRKRRVEKRFSVLPMMFVLLIVGTFAVVYVLLDSTSNSIDNELGRLDSVYERLTEEFRVEEGRLSLMTTPQMIADALDRHGLNMNLAQDGQIVRFQPSGTMGTYQERTQYADRR